MGRPGRVSLPYGKLTLRDAFFMDIFSFGEDEERNNEQPYTQ